MGSLVNKRILLGITGSIAAYKSAELLRHLRKQGAKVRVVMSSAAEKFVTPLTMQTLSGQRVYTELPEHAAEATMEHIELAGWCDCVLIAPASANFMANLAHGHAAERLGALCLATTAPMILAPAMNKQMWLNPATEENVAILKRRKIIFLGPEEGDQACGEFGLGRMLEPVQLLQYIKALLSNNLLADLRVLVTAGPTHEAIDPVRYMTNYSSGRMGYAVAQAALEAGAKVILVSGPATVDPPRQVDCISVKTAVEMRDAVVAHIADAEIFISAAAVSDYRCVDVAKRKIKKKSSCLKLVLDKNPDILSEISSLTNPPFTVGFAAETDNVADNAKAKLRNKKLDMIVANKVGENLGFQVAENSLEVFWMEGNQVLKLAPKLSLAYELIRIIADRFHAKNTNQISG